MEPTDDELAQLAAFWGCTDKDLREPDIDRLVREVRRNPNADIRMDCYNEDEMRTLRSQLRGSRLTEAEQQRVSFTWLTWKGAQ